MAKLQNPHTVIANISSANDAQVANTVLCDAASLVTVMGTVTTAGAPSACQIQTTVDPHELITAGTATWVSEPLVNSANFINTALGPITGVRFDVAASGGTWTLTARQVYDSARNN